MAYQFYIGWGMALNPTYARVSEVRDYRRKQWRADRAALGIVE
jgi:hypothetical protein